MRGTDLVRPHCLVKLIPRLFINPQQIIFIHQAQSLDSIFFIQTTIKDKEL